jgi:hypothetical protein
MGISLSATPILPVVDLPKLIHKIIMLPPGTRSLGYLTLDIALLRSEIRTPLFVLSVPAVTATIVRLILIPLIRVPLILLWRIIRSLLRGRSGDTGTFGSGIVIPGCCCCADASVLHKSAEIVPARMTRSFMLTSPDPVPIIYRDRYLS